MHLQYRPKYLPRDHETGAQRVRRRLGLKGRTAFAPEPHVAPSALYAPADDPRQPYLPGPVLCAQDGLVLFRDGPAAAWPKGKGAEPVRPYPPFKRLPLWVLALQGAMILAAIIAGAIVMPGAGQ